MVCAGILFSCLADIRTEDLLRYLDRFVDKHKLVKDGDRYWLAVR